jgi:hypothetical protein
MYVTYMRSDPWDVLLALGAKVAMAVLRSR